MLKARLLLQDSHNIAVVRTDRLGDMVLTLPLCRSIKEQLPNSALTLIARSYTEPLLINCKAYDKVLYIDNFNGGIDEIFKKNKFDAVFYPRPRLNEAWAGFKNRIKLRIGSAYRYYSFLFNHRVHDHRKNAAYHEAEYNVRMIESITGIPSNVELVKPFVSQESVENIDKTLLNNGIRSNVLINNQRHSERSEESSLKAVSGFFAPLRSTKNDTCETVHSESNLEKELNYTSSIKKIVLIHPATGGSAYEWSTENFGKVANELAMDKNIQVIITGTKEESAKCDVVHSLAPTSINLCGKINLSEMIALISKASLLLANSTGVIHIAAASGIPVVGLYPNSPHLSPRRWGPYSKNSINLTPPPKPNIKFNDNMGDIAIENVLKECLSFL
jgi:heptosyltransferase III